MSDRPTISLNALNDRHNEYLAVVRREIRERRSTAEAVAAINEAQVAYVAWFAERGIVLTCELDL